MQEGRYLLGRHGRGGRCRRGGCACWVRQAASPPIPPTPHTHWSCLPCQLVSACSPVTGLTKAGAGEGEEPFCRARLRPAVTWVGLAQLRVARLQASHVSRWLFGSAAQPTADWSCIQSSSHSHFPLHPQPRETWDTALVPEQRTNSVASGRGSRINHNHRLAPFIASGPGI